MQSRACRSRHLISPPYARIIRIWVDFAWTTWTTRNYAIISIGYSGPGAKILPGPAWTAWPDIMSVALAVRYLAALAGRDNPWNRFQKQGAGNG